MWTGATTRFGMRVGPLLMSDIVGLELGMPRGKDREAALRNGTFDPKHNLQEALVMAGRRASALAPADTLTMTARVACCAEPQVRAMLEQVRENWKGHARWASPRSIPEDEIVNRLMMPLVNEGFKILEEGFARRPADIDVCCTVTLSTTKGGPCTGGPAGAGPGQNYAGGYWRAAE